MAEIALGAFLQVLFEKTTSLTPHLVGHFKSLLGANVHKEMIKLQRTLKIIQAVLEDAEKKQVKDTAVRLWLANLKDVVYDADDILDEFHWEVLRQEAEDSMKDKVRYFFSSDNPILFHIRMGHRIKKVVEKLDLIAAERSKFNLSICSGSVNNHQVGSSNRTETHSFVIESEIVGRREDKDKIVETLISLNSRDCPSVFPIVGMGGLGKTTLAQMVYNDQKVKDHFQLLMWVCVSDDFDIASLAKKIIESAKGNLGGGSSMDSLQQSLREALKSKRYLLVLDDIWNENASKWEELRVLLSQGGKGSVVLVTTRSQKISAIMGTTEALHLAQLSDEDCWTLFKQRALGAEEPLNLVDIGKAIVQKFRGLPLAAKTVGGFMMRLNKDEKKWQSVLQNEIWDLPAEENDILPALRLSYDHLPSRLKECFTYCAIFPKDYRLRKEVLIQLWMANGLIPDGGDTDLEDKGHDIFNELVSRSFLQDVEECTPTYRSLSTTYCKMHDLVNDLAQAITKNECRCILEDKELGGNTTTTRHVFIGSEATTTMIDKVILTFSKSMLTLITSPPSSENVWLKAKSLRVLDLSGCNIKEIPDSIDNFKHLRYLNLSRTKIETLPEAATRLFHLQTLKLEYCVALRELPKGMKKMKNLRHLHIFGCCNLICMPSGMRNLICLQTLPIYVVGSKRGSGNIRELKELKIRDVLHLHGLNNVKNGEDAKEACLISKPDLQSVVLDWHSNEPSSYNAQEVLHFLQPHQNIKRLEVSWYPATGFPNWMMNCAAHLPNLVEIYLYDCHGCTHLPVLGQLRSLEVLRIRRMNGVKCIGGSESPFYGGGAEIFPMLKLFELTYMANLEEWLGCEVTGASTFFPRLLELTIEDCPKLTAVPHLPSIKVLRVCYCPLLFPEKGFFMKMNSLKELYMHECHKLALLLSNEGIRDSNTFPGHLEDLDIKYCNELVSLSDEFMRRLSSLRRLEISACKNLVGSLPSSSSSSSTAIRGERGLQLHYLTALERFKICHCRKLVVNPLELPPCLREFIIFQCPNLQSLSEELGRLTTLRELMINSCKNLVSLPQTTGCLFALRSLKISDCKSLASLPDGLRCLTSLEELGIIRCTAMTMLPECLGRLSRLRTLAIGSCSLVSWPQSLGCLTNLVHLEIHDLTWSSLPHCLGGLTALVVLEIFSCRSLTSLPQGLGTLTQLKNLAIYDCIMLTSLPEGLEGLTKLVVLWIQRSPKMISLPESLQPQLPRLQLICIRGCPDLQRRCAHGGEYWHLVSSIPELDVESPSRNSEDIQRLLRSCCFRSVATLLRQPAVYFISLHL